LIFIARVNIIWLFLNLLVLIFIQFLFQFMNAPLQTKKLLNIIVIVAALGYFVDVYDLILFAIVRVPSLKSMGLTDIEIHDKGVFLLNMQMIGMLAGGLLWGILGDRKGRVSVLFGSIVLYSVANILNGFASSVSMYGWLRLIAGIGLAGELGAGITLVSETMTKENRGYGTMIVVSFGVLGAVLAALVGKYFAWQTAYFIGGALGLFLLLLRIGVYESGMYEAVEKSVVSKGNFFQLFNTRKRTIKYLSCITIGLPIWFLIGILITFSNDFAKHLGVTGVVPGTAVMMFYIGTSFGDFMSGYLSQVLKNRKKVVYLYLFITVVAIPVYLFSYNISLEIFYFICAFVGLAGGYWAVFVTMASEQFGTNIRSTVTTTVPNFVRGALVPLLLCFEYIKNHSDLITAALVVGFSSVIIAFIALWGMEETHGKDLDYFEVD
jgi:putative MFS transporter